MRSLPWGYLFFLLWFFSCWIYTALSIPRRGSGLGSIQLGCGDISGSGVTAGAGCYYVVDYADQYTGARAHTGICAAKRGHSDV